MPVFRMRCGHDSPIGPGGASSAMFQRARTRSVRGERSPARRRVQSGDRDHRRIVGAELRPRIVHARAPCLGRGRCRRARSARLAPTPPATTSVACPVASSAAQRLGAQGVDDRLLHAAGDVGALSAGVSSWPFTASITAVFSPEKLKSSPGRSSIGRGKRKRARAARAWPGAASSGPPGYGSPAASRSCRRPRRRRRRGSRPAAGTGRCRGTSISSVWPPDTSSARCGNRRRRILQQRRQQVALQVVHADGRQPPAIGEGLRQRRAGQQRADQAGTRRIGDAAEFRRPGPGRRQGLAHQGQQAAHVIARGQLGHHAAVQPVQVDLAVESCASRPRIVVEHRHGALIAGRFDGPGPA